MKKTWSRKSRDTVPFKRNLLLSCCLVKNLFFFFFFDFLLKNRPTVYDFSPVRHKSHATLPLNKFILLRYNPAKDKFSQYGTCYTLYAKVWELTFERIKFEISNFTKWNFTWIHMKPDSKSLVCTKYISRKRQMQVLPKWYMKFVSGKQQIIMFSIHTWCCCKWFSERSR